MTPAEAIRGLLKHPGLADETQALEEALQIVEGVARVREALEAGDRNLSGVSRAAYHYVLEELAPGERPRVYRPADAPAKPGEYVETLQRQLHAERDCNLANTAELHRADALIGELREALWAVRVLDAYCRARNTSSDSQICFGVLTHKVRPRLYPTEPAFLCQTIGSRNGYVHQDLGEGETEDAARIAAAKALVAEDPTLNPPELDL